MLKIYNTYTNQKEQFKPIEPNKVRMYVCGMTVYDLCHLGHARVLVVFDMVTRYFKTQGYDVTYVRNVTDIDDKIIARANENGEDFNALTERFIQAMHEDAAALGVLPPDEEPRATASMDDIINMIVTLIEKGFAYAASNGDVYYDVSKFETYGKLSGKKTEDLRAGERVAVDKNKNDPLDFVLWKAAKPNEPFWDSPWGKGRPGWHIECSAMSTCCLGNTFDIHGGGQDLQFPHHENEIAQSEAATGEKFVNLWMHNGFVRIDDEKMSKSLGNFFTIREILEKYRAEDVRYFILASHYRSPLNYADTMLDSAGAALSRLYTALRDTNATEMNDDSKEYVQRFEAAMNEDFNTAEAVSVLFDLANSINKLKTSDAEKASALAATLKHLGNILGLLEDNPENYLKSGGSENTLSDAEIDSFIQQRMQAKADKNWGEADRIRDALKTQGIELEDKGAKTSWRRA
ncbi:Cysteinyl-tRNA synthetase [hydrothermal vent metagenome]|uniref:Cysteine--tRNA ligase n=1 Tax=hydrothermal vent metagenome TaxID=652676 RepID=A0A3B0XD86_9ZZZZ